VGAGAVRSPLAPRRAALVIALVLIPALIGAPAGALPGDGGRAEDVVTEAAAYRATLAAVLEAGERELARAQELVSDRRRYLLRGIITERELKDAERAAREAETKVRKARLRVRDAETVIAEAMATEQLWAPPSAHAPAGAPALISYAGGQAWSLAHMAKIQKFFTARFGRALPISAYGQTPAHDRLGLDHANAVDVAVHPGSREGRALLAYLTEAKIAFLAFRSAVPGSATGAHIHIGKTSERRAAGTASRSDLTRVGQ
jgi:hypothetical protein